MQVRKVQFVNEEMPTRDRASGLGLGLGLIAFLVAHVPLATLMYRVPLITTLHAIATLAIGLWFAAADRRLERVAYVGAYIAGAEVLWRMTSAQVFWEFGKYATAVIFIVAMVRSNCLKGPFLPLLYFVLLLPSSTLTLLNMNSAAARDQLSFNLSGPFALMASAWFFSNLKLSAGKLKCLFLALIGPVVGIASITFLAIQQNTDLSFSGGSNFQTSGGFGPNQVSSALGLGALLAFSCIVILKGNFGYKIVMLVIVIVLTVQSALTFSRGGLYNAAAGALLAAVYLIRGARSRVQFILVVALLFGIANFLLLPRLDAFTDGALSARFENVNTTGRDSLAEDDLQVWSENPLFGVGPGQAKSYREYYGVAAHTEFTRLLSEHGSFGFVAIILLMVAGVQNLMRARSPADKAVVSSMMGWSFLFMLNAAMRLVAPSFTFGLTFTMLAPETLESQLDLAYPEGYRVIPARQATKISVTAKTEGLP